MSYKKFRALFFLLSIIILPQLSADVTLPKVIADNMVLQRGEPINIWGWAAANEKVTVSFAGKNASATAGADGSWKVELPAQEANKTAQTMTIKGNNEITLKNILLEMSGWVPVSPIWNGV